MNRHVPGLVLGILEPFHQKSSSLLYLVLGAKLDENPACSKVLSKHSCIVFYCATSLQLQTGHLKAPEGQQHVSAGRDS